KRLNKVREIDILNDSLTVESGVILADIQRIASEHDRLFPLSLASEGSCQVGGNLSTNAGGIQVLRYGNARALVLGLEVVTAKGEIWEGLGGLRKDNAGYDLKQLFIGAEGTLGIITAVTLKLFPKPSDSQVALVAVTSTQAAIDLLSRLKMALGEQLTAYELMHNNCFDFAEQSMGHSNPLPGGGWRVLFQADGQTKAGYLCEPVEAVLTDALEDDLISDAVIATSLSQAQQLWRIREDQAEIQQRTGAGVKHDISVPISKIPVFIEQADTALEAAYPGIQLCTFGHAGDGNLHYNPIRPKNWTDDQFKAETAKINRIVHDIAYNLDGSITAEHGVGQLRREELGRYKSPTALLMMCTIKQALDPQNIFNPGKIL
ncbi:MAG: FAD-binding oxidoreductase, partial [Sneathiella sp.]|nr:FAD-binding oxidoreductase [Sneathiella sp.]